MTELAPPLGDTVRRRLDELLGPHAGVGASTQASSHAGATQSPSWGALAEPGPGARSAAPAGGTAVVRATRPRTASPPPGRQATSGGPNAARRLAVVPPDPEISAAPPDAEPWAEPEHPRGLAGLPAAVARFGRPHLVVVAIIALAGLAWAGLTMVQARSVPVLPVAVSASPAGGPSVGGPAPVTPTATPAQVQIHVVGAVKTPGVVRLPDGARVQDALNAAGGLTADARPGELNLAAPVADGAQIQVGTAAHPGGQVRPPGEGAAGTGGAPPGTSPANAAGSAAKVNLNSATAEQLDALPGVGPVTAQGILAWRAKHGRFTRVEELQEVDGIGAKTFAQLAPRVTV